VTGLFISPVWLSLAEMHNLLAAAGHSKYAKLTHLYLQVMLELPTDYPWLHDKFMHEGFHAVRRSARVWAGLSTDLTTEQIMMRAVKGRSSLTHGRGMSETCSPYVGENDAQICNCLCSTMLHDKSGSVLRHQHADASLSQAKRDCSDISS